MSAQSIPPRIVSVAELSRRSSLSVGHLYRMMQEGTLPRPVRVTPGRVGWSAELADAWIADRLKGGAA
jgi:predicted DNA-binding transcriptional regulator AlpA